MGLLLISFSMINKIGYLLLNIFILMYFMFLQRYMYLLNFQKNSLIILFHINYNNYFSFIFLLQQYLLKISKVFFILFHFFSEARK